MIGKAERGEIDALLTTILNRYRELYPGWEISIISLEKDSDRTGQMDRVIALLEQMKNSEAAPG